MPARVSSSVHGRYPGELGIRFCTWQALVAEPLLTYTTPFGATTRWLAWPTLSANTVAQNPAGSVMPPLSSAQTGFVVVRCSPRAASNDPVVNSKPMMSPAYRKRRDREPAIRIGFVLLRRVSSAPAQ